MEDEAIIHHAIMARSIFFGEIVSEEDMRKEWEAIKAEPICPIYLKRVQGLINKSQTKRHEQA